MKILIVSANSLAAAPTGPAYIAGAAVQAGHNVETFECLFTQDAPAELKAHIRRFQPDVVGISIRLVHAYVIDKEALYNTRHLDLRPNMRTLVDAARASTSAPIVLGGPGFNYYAQDWLDYLDLDAGIRGEADFAFPLYLERLEQGAGFRDVPGMVYRQDGHIVKNPRQLVENLDETAFPAYELFDLAQYQQHGISPGILTKRGCAFRCTYCPYSTLEGRRYRVKSAGRVVDEMERIHQQAHPKMVMLCENNFNVPKPQAAAICRELAARGLGQCWGTGDLRPMGIDAEFCRLLSEAGCSYVSLSVESGSDAMLKRMGRGYTSVEVRKSLECLQKAGIPFGASLMLGAPGETPETIQETFDLMDAYDIPYGTWVTIGICLWTPRQAMLETARQSGQISDDRMLFEATNYLSPELPRSYMEDLIDRLRLAPGYTVQVNQPYAGYNWAHADPNS